MRLNRLFAVVGASMTLAAPATRAAFGRQSVNISQPFEVDHLYMSMDSVWDTSSGIDVNFVVTDANTGVNTLCDTADVHANTVYSCARDETKWLFNYDFSKLSIEWFWPSSEISDNGLNGNYRANASTTVNWNCASSGSYGQQCFANKFNVPIKTTEAWA